MATLLTSPPTSASGARWRRALRALRSRLDRKPSTTRTFRSCAGRTTRAVLAGAPLCDEPERAGGGGRLGARRAACRRGFAAIGPTGSHWSKGAEIGCSRTGPSATLRPRPCSTRKWWCRTVVYVNVMGPMASSGPPHIDVPAFRGLDRREAPVWLLHVMRRSGPLRALPASTSPRRWRGSTKGRAAPTSTGPRGRMRPWPRSSAPLSNRAVVGRQRRHVPPRRRRSARADAPQPEGATLDAELRPVAGADGDLGRSSTAIVSASATTSAISASASRGRPSASPTRRRRRSGASTRDDLDLDHVVTRFVEDAAERGVRIARPEDPFHDPAFVEQLSGLHPLRPPVV